MTPDRSKQIDDLVKAVLDRAPAERPLFLDRMCAGDAELRRGVEARLASHSETIGRYQVIEEIGRGGMGRVLLARDTRLGRRVAIKVLLREHTRDGNRMRRFEQEARAASALNHPNILVIHEIGESDGTRFIATEFVEGRTVRAILDDGPMSVRDVLDVAIQCAGALAAAHLAGVIHRDIKPENVMVRPDGLVKVLDFSIAKLTEATTEESEGEFSAVKTLPGTLLGTINYMSPEQLDDVEPDARTDVFSLGVVLFEMLAGHRPFKGTSRAAVMRAIMYDEPSLLADVAPDVPDELSAIVARMLVKNRDGRYASAADVVADLKAFRQTMELSSLSGETRPASTTTAGDEELPVESTIITARPWSARRRAITVAATLLLLLGSAVPVYLWMTADESLAVLPFSYTNASAAADPERDYLADGLTESLIFRLSQTPGVRVIGRSSVFRYKGAEADPREVGRALGVRSILTGRIVQRGDALLITAELVDARSGSVLWSDQYVRRVADLLVVQREIALAIAEQLSGSLSGEGQRRITSHETENAEAYQLYIRGRYLWNQRSAASISRSVELYEQAIALDPSFALAYAALADSYALLPTYADAPGAEAIAAGKTAALRALEIDPQLAEAHTSLGFMLAQYDLDWAGAERSLRRAIELKPGYPTAHHWLSNVLTMEGRFDEAIASAKRARDLDPVSTAINTQVGNALYFARRYDESIAQLEQVVELAPTAPGVKAHLGLAYEGAGRYDEAIAEFQKAIDLTAPRASFRGRLAHAYAASGRTIEARRLLAELEANRAAEPISCYQLAVVYAALGDRDAAFAWVARGFDEDLPDGLWLKVDPQMDGLRDDPRYADMVRRIGLTP